jgi:pectate lyase
VAFAAAPTGQERWVGLIARYANDRNYYYVTLRSGNTLSLRKLVNGAITELASVPVTVSTGSWYALRLEVMATTLRVYLGSTMVMQVMDATHAQGRGGLMTYKAAAQFDDYAAYQP